MPAFVLRIAPLHEERLALPVKVTFVDDVAVSIEFSNHVSIAIDRAARLILLVEVCLFLDVVVFIVALADAGISLLRTYRMVIPIEELGLGRPSASVVRHGLDRI